MVLTLTRFGGTKHATATPDRKRKNMNARLIGGIATVAVVMGFLIFFVVRSSSQTPPSPAPVRMVSDVAEDGNEYAVQHTFLCVLPDGVEARDWHFTDRWVKNQLSYDFYHAGGVTGRPVVAIRQVASVKRGHVRFIRQLMNLTGPSLEGHDYLQMRVNGQTATIQEDVLFVEHNVVLEAQARPLPACGTPRS